MPTLLVWHLNLWHWRIHGDGGHYTPVLRFFTYLFRPLLPFRVEGVPESLPLHSVLYCPFHLFPCYSFLRFLLEINTLNPLTFILLNILRFRKKKILSNLSFEIAVLRAKKELHVTEKLTVAQLLRTVYALRNQRFHYSTNLPIKPANSVDPLMYDFRNNGRNLLVPKVLSAVGMCETCKSTDTGY